MACRNCAHIKDGIVMCSGCDGIRHWKPKDGTKAIYEYSYSFRGDELKNCCGCMFLGDRSDCMILGTALSLEERFKICPLKLRVMEG